MSWLARARKEPYTAIGITRVDCVRCGQPAVHQWQVCADKNRFRALCLDCDIALNRLVLQWAKDPNWKAKCDRYEQQARLDANLPKIAS